MTRAIQRDYFHVPHLSIAKAIPNGAKSCCGHISRIHSVARSATVFHLTMQMHLDTNPTLLAVAELEMNRRGGHFQHSQGRNGGGRNEAVEAQFFSVGRDVLRSATSARLDELYTRWAFEESRL